jgi:hypothetical protein
MLFERSGERWRKELPGRFTKLDVSPDGRFAVAYAPATGLSLSDAVAVVDLNDGASLARNVRLSDTTGRPATSFAFADVANGERPLMLARGTDRIQLVDLNHLERTPTSVELKLPGDGRQLEAGEVIFHGDRIYVQVHDSRDVLLLQLVPVPSEAGGFTVAPLQLAADAPVLDIELIDLEGQLYLAALGGNAITMIEPVTGSGITSELGNYFSNLLTFRARSPLDDAPKNRGLLFQPSSSVIAFVDFDDGSAWARQSVETLVLQHSVAHVIPDLAHELVVLVYESGGLALLDLAQRTISPLDTGSRVSGTLLDAVDGESRLWLTLEDGRLGHIDLLRLEASELLLNAPVQNLLAVAGRSRRIVAVHASESGYVTLIDPDAPMRESARELVGFLYSQIFD